MRVFKNYKDYLENKKSNENGITQDFLNKFYHGNINQAQADSIYCFNCFNCNNCDYCIHCENFNDRNIKDNQS